MTMPHDDGLEDFADLMASAPSGASHVSLSAEDAERLRRRRRRRRRGWLIAAGVVLAIVAGTGGYTAWALSAPLPALETTTRVPTVAPGAPAALAMPSGRAAAISVVGAAGDLGAAGLHAVSGDDQPRPIASISKLITALVVLDAHPLQSADDPGPTITFDKADHDLYDQYYVLGATVAAMPTGSSMSLRDALTTMLLPSASNYADAVAMWAFGSRSGYVSATRTWLQAHQLNGTTIVEPTGIDERNTSTPSDLLAIGQLAAANPALARNDLLGSDGVTGLKTGNLGAGTFALLYTATSNPGLGEPLKIVGVSLDGQSREQVDADVTTALRSVAAGVHLVPVAKAGTPVGTVTSPWGGEAQLVLSRDESLLTWSDTPITASITLTIAPTGQDGQQIGIATWTSGGRSASVAVAVRGTIAPPDDWWKLTHPSLLGGPAPSPSPSVSPSPTPTAGG